MVIIIGWPRPIKVSWANQTNCGPAKPDFGLPDWPAKEKVKLDPCYSTIPTVNCLFYFIVKFTFITQSGSKYSYVKWEFFARVSNVIKSLHQSNCTLHVWLEI